MSTEPSMLKKIATKRRVYAFLIEKLQRSEMFVALNSKIEKSSVGTAYNF